MGKVLTVYNGVDSSKLLSQLFFIPIINLFHYDINTSPLQQNDFCPSSEQNEVPVASGPTVAAN